MYTWLTMMLHRSAPILWKVVFIFFIHASRPNSASFLEIMHLKFSMKPSIERVLGSFADAAAPILRLNCLNFQKDHDCPETLHYNTSRLNSILLWKEERNDDEPKKSLSFASNRSPEREYYTYLHFVPCCSWYNWLERTEHWDKKTLLVYRYICSFHWHYLLSWNDSFEEILTHSCEKKTIFFLMQAQLLASILLNF